MMKNYTAKTVQDAVNLACQELGVTIDELNYEVIKETKTALNIIATVLMDPSNSLLSNALAVPIAWAADPNPTP